MEPEPLGAAFFLPGAGADQIWLEPEPTQFGRSWSRLRDLGLSEPEPLKKRGGAATLRDP